VAMSARRTHLECKTQRQGCYHNDGNEVPMVMCKHPGSYFIHGHIVSTMKREGLISANHDETTPTSEEDLYLLFCLL
jgi:hypothetical protein